MRGEGEGERRWDRHTETTLHLFQEWGRHMETTLHLFQEYLLVRPT